MHRERGPRRSEKGLGMKASRMRQRGKQESVMTRHRFILLAALAAALVAPSIGFAFFPPSIGMPPTVPPDAFKPPTTAGLGGAGSPPQPTAPRSEPTQDETRL